MTLEGKRLLIIGANPETIPLVAKAKDLGVTTLVTDYNPHAPAKEHADERFDVDGFDVDGLVTLARKERVDGVLVGVADRLIVPYQQVCERLNVPCYGSRRQCEILTDKVAFAEECAKFGIQTIPSFDVPRNPSPEVLSGLKYPLLVKPPDGNSGQGIAVCRRPEEVPAAIEEAIEKSKSQRYLVERYMECDDVFLYYTFLDGVCLASVVADRFTNRVDFTGSPVCKGDVSPSRYADLYFSTLHEKMEKMFSDMNLQTAVLMVSAFVENGRFYLYDPGFRLQGAAPNLTIREMTNLDQLDLLIRFALGEKSVAEKSGSQELTDCRSWGRFAATVWVLLKEGTIGEIDGLDYVDASPNVFSSVVRFRVGDTITRDMLGTERQVFARVYLSAASCDELAHAVEGLNNALRIKDEQGGNMIIAMLDANDIASK